MAEREIKFTNPKTLVLDSRLHHHALRGESGAYEA